MDFGDGVTAQAEGSQILFQVGLSGFLELLAEMS